MRSTFSISFSSQLFAFKFECLLFFFYLGCFNLFIVYFDVNWLPLLQILLPLLLVSCMQCNSIIFRHHVYRTPNYPFIEIFSDRISIFNALCDPDSLFIRIANGIFFPLAQFSSAVDLVLCWVDTNFFRKTPTTSVLKKIARHVKRIILREKKIMHMFFFVWLPKMR